MDSERGPSPERAPTGATRRFQPFVGPGLNHEVRPIPAIRAVERELNQRKGWKSFVASTDLAKLLSDH
jgi:hypothetical protein